MFLTGIFGEVIGALVLSAGKMLSATAAFSFQMVKNTLEVPVVMTVILYVQSIASALLVAKLVFEIIQTYFLGRANDPDESPSWILMHGALACGLIWCCPYIVKFISEFGMAAMMDLFSLNIFDPTRLSEGFTALANIPNDDFGNMFFYNIMILLLMIIIFVAFFQLAVRGLELVVLTIIGPIICINASSQNRSLFHLWLKQTFVIIGTQFVQVFIILIGCNSLITDITTWEAKLAAFAWFLLAIVAPKTVQVFMSESTGTAGGIKGIVSTAGMAVRGIR